MLVSSEIPELLTADQVSKLLGWHPRTVLNAASRGELRCIRLGPRTIRFHPDDVKRYLDAHRKGS
jgi:excisionase family DNA binding protein